MKHVHSGLWDRRELDAPRRRPGEELVVDRGAQRRSKHRVDRVRRARAECVRELRDEALYVLRPQSLEFHRAERRLDVIANGGLVAGEGARSLVKRVLAMPDVDPLADGEVRIGRTCRVGAAEQVGLD